MSAGLQIVNNNGVVIIDENYPCLTLRTKGTMTASLQGGAYIASFTTAADLPVVAFYSAGGPCTIRSRINSGGNWTFTVVTTGTYTIEWYLFDRPQYAAGTNVGLQVFDASGVLVYTSSAFNSIYLDQYNQTSTYIMANGGIMGWVTSGSYGGGSNKLGVVFGDLATAWCVMDDYGNGPIWRIAFQNLGPGSLQWRMGVAGTITGVAFPSGWFGVNSHLLIVNLDGL